MHFLFFSNSWWGTSLLSAIAWPALMMNFMAVLIYYSFSSHNSLYTSVHAWKGILHVLQSLWMVGKYSPFLAIQDLLTGSITNEGCRYFVFWESFAPSAQAFTTTALIWLTVINDHKKNKQTLMKSLYLGLILTPSLFVAYMSSFGNTSYTNRYCYLAVMATLWIQLLPIVGLVLLQSVLAICEICKDGFTSWSHILFYFVHLVEEVLFVASLCLSIFPVSEGFQFLILAAYSVCKFVDGLNLFGSVMYDGNNKSSLK